MLTQTRIAQNLAEALDCARILETSEAWLSVARWATAAGASNLAKMARSYAAGGV